jgi:integrating conjugative element relaxase (TIGR03760 family)
MLKRFAALFYSRVPVVSAPEVQTLVQTYSYPDLAQRTHKPVLTGDALIELLQLHSRIAEVRDLMGLPESDWQICCMDALRNFAEAVQLAPASEIHHHAFCGGLLVHTLDAIVIALKIRRKFSLPTGAGAERVNEAATRWTYGVFCALLLHDPGKVGAGVSLLAKTAEGQARWSPLNGSMRKHGVVEYQLSFEKAPYKLHNQIGLALFSELIPEPGRRWLSVDQELLQQLLCAVGDVHAPGSGVIGEILVQADGQSVAKDLGQPKSKGQTIGASGIALVDKYMRSLRGLLASNKLALNKPGAQVFVTRRKNAPEATSDVWILCRAAAEAIVKDLRESDASVPSAPERVYDTLQEHGMCLATPSGKAIWNATVHCGSWCAEFSLLRMEAHRLWGPGKVPAAFAGSVKVKKSANPGAAVKATSETVAHSVEPRPTAQGMRYFLDDVSTAGPEELTAASEAGTSAPEVLADMVATEAALLAKLSHASKKPPKTAPAKVPTAVHEVSPESTAGPGVTHETTASGAAKKPTSVPVANSGASVAKVALAESFFAWIQSLLEQEGTDINSATAMIHTHDDGLLLVTPKIFRAFAGDTDWVALQTAVTASGYMLCTSRHHVHNYMIRDPQGKVSKATLKCAVVLPSACKVLFGALPPHNKSILGRS